MVWVAVALLLAAAGTAQAASDAERAAAAMDRVEKTLGARLKAALAEGGPVAAIDVCRVEAPALTAAAAAPGVRVGRTSHRLRNPANAPAPWMLPLLEELQAEPAGTATLRQVDLGEAGTGFARAIYTKPLCLTCHGENVAPELLAHIRERYPQDRAVGFAPGELRGMFWAVVQDAPAP